MQTIPANQLLAGLTLAEPVAIRAVVTDSRKVEPGSEKQLADGLTCQIS